jgi:hypothetical protein
MATRFRKHRSRSRKTKAMKTRKHKGGFFGLFQSSTPTPPASPSPPVARSKEDIQSNLNDKIMNYTIGLTEVVKLQDQAKQAKTPQMVQELQMKQQRIKNSRLAGLREDLKKLNAELKAVDPSSNYINAAMRNALQI